MGTNYYRIPKSKEVMERHISLVHKIMSLDIWDPANVENGFRTIEKGFDRISPWEEFLTNMNIHLGKRSMGWKFCWNFHDGKFYKNKEELLDFIRSGRVVDEYGELMDTEDFIEMALNWDGIVADEEYFKNNETPSWLDWQKHLDKDIDGLRVSSATEFS